jgi:nitrile hydratase subunit beta
MGGMMNFGPVCAEPNEPLFHAPWEPRALALTLAMGATGQWNIDASRSARESLPPAEYLSSSYYEIWIKGLEKLLLARQLLSIAELAAGHALDPPRPLARILKSADVPAVLAKGSPTERPAQHPARFAVGQMVLSKTINPTGHTRLPRYIRGKPGVIFAQHGAHVFPDSHAHGTGEAPQWLYTVLFEARELWGPDTTADSVCVDCWESYLI